MELEPVGAAVRPVPARELQALVERVLRAGQRFDRLEREVRETRDEFRAATDALLAVVPEAQLTPEYSRVRLVCARCGQYERSMHANDERVFQRHPLCPCCLTRDVTVTTLCRTGGATSWERLAGPPAAGPPTEPDHGFATCDEPRCDERATVRGKCGRHYMRAWRATRKGTR